MFGIKLSFYRWNRNVCYWLMNKLQNKITKQKSIDDVIYKDILHTFAYNEDGYYRLYMKNAPIDYLDLEGIIQDLRGDYTSVNEVDLNYEYNFLLEHITSKLMWYPSVRVHVHNEDGVKYFEVYWKNFKQTIK